MIPLRDANPSDRTPFVTFALIGLNTLVYLYELSLGGLALNTPAVNSFFQTMGMIPARVGAFPAHPDISLGDAFVPFFTSMFLHGGFFHLLGNMWFLWIFGDNIEDRLGHFRFVLFYLVCGLGAGLTHLMFNWGSQVPVIGASGAVAGVLGGYLLLYPRARVLTLIPLFYFLIMRELPAYLILLYWFVLQLFSGAASVGAQGGGVAWWAHVGGFLLG
ncbi:MAG: rhomboid family intramembrane serine protease, partial [Terriglobia bacterium]